MKTYKELMEVMSISDMNTITGGTDAQRKIAQDRQKKREAKDKGFDASKPVLADGKPAQAAPAPTKPVESPKSTDLAKSSALAKTDTKALPSSDRKPELRKSQLGKWSQGAKTSPGQLAKKKETGLTKTSPVKEVDVKVTPSDETKVAKRPGTSRPIDKDNSVIKNLPRKTKEEPTNAPGAAKTPKVKTDKLKGVKSAGKKALNLGKNLAGKAKKFMDVPSDGVDTYGETEHTGLGGRNKGVGN